MSEGVLGISHLGGVLPATQVRKTTSAYGYIAYFGPRLLLMSHDG